MANLILPSLEIQNFRAFEHLRIERLGRVNLITGKNNVGKTSLLEAMYLYARGNSSYVRELLVGRDEIRSVATLSASAKVEEIDRQFKNVRHLFHGRKQIIDKPRPIRVGSIGGEKMLIAVTDNLLEDVFNYGTESFARVPKEELARSLSLAGSNPVLSPVQYVVFRTPINSWSFVTAHDFIERGSGLNLSVGGNSICIFLQSSGLQMSTAGQQWDRLALTPDEDNVLDALRIIVPDVQRLGFIGEEDEAQGRTPLIRLIGMNEPLPMRSMGEGMNRLFGIALALTAARDGILLIDEVETGLHYSVMPDVWKLIFQVAQRLNVQVFATTHSWDCIEAFERAAHEDENAQAELIHLMRQDNSVIAVLYDKDELGIVTEEMIEVR